MLSASIRKIPILLFRPGDTAPWVTAFIVQSGESRYLITAKHCIDHTSVFTLDRKQEQVQLPEPFGWTRSKVSDIACFELEGDTFIDQQTVSTTDFLEEPISIGTPILIPVFLADAAKAYETGPVVRFGKLASEPSEHTLYLSPDEPFRDSVYVVEAFSWGGYSGGPVFADMGGSVKLLGCIQGHHSQEVNGIRVEQQTSDSGFPTELIHRDVTVKVNSGLAFITPAQNIKPLLVAR